MKIRKIQTTTQNHDLPVRNSHPTSITADATQATDSTPQSIACQEPVAIAVPPGAPGYRGTGRRAAGPETFEPDRRAGPARRGVPSAGRGTQRRSTPSAGAK